MLNSISEENRRIYTATISRSSLQNIAKYCIGQTLSSKLVNIVSQQVRKDICEVVEEAAKYSRRTCCSNVTMEHLLFAMKEHCIDLDLMHVEYTWPKDEDTEATAPREPNRKLSETSHTVEKGSTSPAAGMDLTDFLAAPNKWLQREPLYLMTYLKFPLSVEQQEYFVQVTDNCMGFSESTRCESLELLSTDSSLQPMLHKLCHFIGEAVTVNVAEHNFFLLSYLMRMMRSLLINPHLKLHNYVSVPIPF